MLYFQSILNFLELSAPVSTLLFDKKETVFYIFLKM